MQRRQLFLSALAVLAAPFGAKAVAAVKEMRRRALYRELQKQMLAAVGAEKVWANALHRMWMSGNAYIKVGERGPEVFIPNTP